MVPILSTELDQSISKLESVEFLTQLKGNIKSIFPIKISMAIYELLIVIKYSILTMIIILEERGV